MLNWCHRSASPNWQSTLASPIGWRRRSPSRNTNQEARPAKKTLGRSCPIVCSSQPHQLPLNHPPRLRRHQVAQRVRRITTAHTILVGVHLQLGLRPVRIVLQRRQRLGQPPAPPMKEHRRRHAPSGSPIRCLTSAHSLMRSVFAHRSAIPSRAYWPAIVVSSPQLSFSAWLRAGESVTNRRSLKAAGTGPRETQSDGREPRENRGRLRHCNG